jgi:hypothetical protein
MRVALVICVLAAEAGAAPWRLEADLDGEPVKLELAGNGALKIDGKGETSTVSIAKSVSAATLHAARVRGVRTVVVEATTPDGEEAIILQPSAGGWKQVVRVPVGATGVDREQTFEIEATPMGILRYQSRAGYRRCDGKPAYLFAEGFDGQKFRRLSRIPTEVPDSAPVVTARADAASTGKPALYQARVASHQPSTSDAAGLGIPAELDDGKPSTFWHEDFSASDGEGQFFTFVPRVAKLKATQLRVIPGNPTSAATMSTFNRPHRLGVVWANGAVHVDLPDAMNDPLGTAYVADLPTPVEGCVSVVLESTYGRSNGTTAIAELEVFAEGERTGGGDAMLAAAVAAGSDGEVAAAQELARHGAAGVAALDAELAKASDDAVRRRLVRALLTMRDPAAAAPLARALSLLHDRDLIDAVAALGALGQTQPLRELAASDAQPLDARIAAVVALARDPKLVIELAGAGPRALRHAVILALADVPVATLIPAAQNAPGAPASGDLWRAVTRRAHAVAPERAEALSAMTTALAGANDYERKYRLVDGIATIGDAEAMRALAGMLRGLVADTSAAAYKQVAARAIADNPRAEALELVLAFARDADPGVRLAALGALAGAEAGTAGPWHVPDGPDSIDRAIQSALATDTWPEVRRRAAQVLGGRCGRIGPARSLADSVARDRDVNVRGDALAALVECKAAGIGELLAKIWNDGKAPLELRERAVDLSVPLGDRALGEKLVKELARWRGAALESAEALALAQNAAFAVGRLAPPGAAAALEAGLDDGAFPEIVSSSATGLGLLGRACPAGAKAKLRELAHGDDQQVATAAARAAAVCGK